MERLNLIEELVALDARINEASGRAGDSASDLEYARIIDEVIELRKQRTGIKAKLDAVGSYLDIAAIFPACHNHE